MAGAVIKNKDTQPESKLRRALWQRNLRYRTHISDLPGTPDIVFMREKVAIFVNGCFWHSHDCRKRVPPKTNTAYWVKKLGETKNRDLRNAKILKSLGFSVVTVWECRINDNIQQCANQVVGRLHFARQRLQDPRTNSSTRRKIAHQTDVSPRSG